jgi:hypothetical protein
MDSADASGNDLTTTTFLIFDKEKKIITTLPIM